MTEFLQLSTPTEALGVLLETLPCRAISIETIDTVHSLGRALAMDIKAPHPLPEFSRSTVDGYAVQARDTFGASESLPAYLNNIGEVLMGKPPPLRLNSGNCSLINTGGMLPEGANAVVMLENTQRIDIPGQDSKTNAKQAEITIMRPVAEGENIIRLGEDVSADQVVLAAGIRIRPAEIGGLMALGIIVLRVANKPRIGIISSGDEVIPPEGKTCPGQVRDINSYSLAALIEEAGGEPVCYGIVPDRLEELKAESAKALEECDALIITAGSSTSARDLTVEAIASLGSPGVLVHGVNLRPGKPTILAVCNGKAVIGLPGNPVSALVVARRFVVPIIEKLLGLKVARLRTSVQARLMVNVSSQAGREDWVAVKLVQNGEGFYQAKPVFGKSNLIFSLVAANGLMRIPPDANGVSAGEMVEVELM